VFRPQPIQLELRTTLQKLPRTNLGSLSASTSALTFPKVVSGFLWRRPCHGVLFPVFARPVKEELT
jgi:hypothetical protein